MINQYLSFFFKKLSENVKIIILDSNIYYNINQPVSGESD